MTPNEVSNLWSESVARAAFLIGKHEGQTTEQKLRFIWIEFVAKSSSAWGDKIYTLQMLRAESQKLATEYFGKEDK